MPLRQPRRRQLTRPHPYVWAAACYLLLAACFYLPQLLGLRAFPEGDFNQHFLPFSLFQRAELLAGRLPVWNPYTYGGHPFLADVQAAVFYPVSNLLLGLTVAFASPAARLYFLEVEAGLHLALAGFFTYLLVYEFYRRQLPAFLAGAVFAFSGYLTGYPPLQLAVLRTAVWLPLALWLLLRAFDERYGSPWRWTVYAALAFTAAFLAGHSQTFLFLAYAVAAWLATLCGLAVWQARPRGARRACLARCAGQIALFGVIFLALSAAQLWPSLEFTAYSVRANVDYAYVSGGFPLSDTWQMLLPGVLTVFSPLYAGVVGLGLASLGLVSALGAWGGLYRRGPAGEGGGPQVSRVRVYVACFAGLGLLALLASYGDSAFLYPLFYRWLPGWRLFRGQERAAYLVAFSLSVLAGCGAAALEAGLPRRQRRAWAAGFGVLVVAGSAWFAIRHAIPGQIDVPLSTFWLTAVTGLLLAGGLVAVAWRAPDFPEECEDGTYLKSPPGDPHLRHLWLHRQVLPWGRCQSCSPQSGVKDYLAGLTMSFQTGPGLALVGLVVADLFLANYHTNLGPATLAQAAAAGPEIAAVQAAVQAHAGADLGLPGRVHNEYRVYDDYGMAAGVEDVWGSSPLKIARYARLFDKFPMDRMWRLLGVEHVLTWQKALPQPSDLLAEFPQAQDTTYLHRLKALNPRAWLVHRARYVDDDTAAGLLADHGFNLDQTALLGAEQTAVGAALPPSLTAGEPAIAAAGTDTVRLSRPAPGRLVAEVTSQGGGLLLAAENWLPGWQAVRRVPGQAGAERLPVLRADLTLLAVPVPAGASTIELAYRPASVYAGLVISAGVAILLVGLWIVGRKRRA